MPKIMYISPFGRKTEPATGRVIDFDAVYAAIKASIQNDISDAEIVRHDEVITGGKIDILAPIDLADVVVCDLTTNNPNCMYEFGYAHGKGKASILITARSGHIPYDLNMYQIAAYDPDALTSEFLERVSAWVLAAVKRPQDFTASARPEQSPKKVFVSYSHKDKAFLDRILVHLKPLEAAGLIDSWVDTRLRAGDRWRQNIEAALESASVAVLLISADFLASDFIVKNELPPMLSKAERDGTRIIPVVLKHCRFSREPSLSIFQSLNSPDQPLSTLDESECERVFDQLAQTLEESVHAA
jgi:hypothetical protein